MDENRVILVEATSGNDYGLSLGGDVTVFHAGELHRAAMQAAEQNKDVVVECGRVQSVDFSAVQILLALEIALSARGRSLRLTGVPACLEEALSLAGLDGRFGRHDDSRPAASPAAAE